MIVDVRVCLEHDNIFNEENFFFYPLSTILCQALVNVDGYYTISFSRIKDKTYFT